jgi:hypothetical protein
LQYREEYHAPIRRSGPSGSAVTFEGKAEV